MHVPSGMIVIGTAGTAAPACAAALRAAAADPGGTPEPIGLVLLHASDARHIDETELPVIGTVAELETICGRFDFSTALISLPAAMSGVIERVRRSLGELDVETRLLPTIEDVLTGATAPGLSGRELDEAALIGRDPRAINEHLARDVVRGKRVLITGAGGSIGSEIARICARFEPAELILMDRSDNALFEIDRQITQANRNVPRTAVLHDVVDAESTRRRLAFLRPNVIFHAAAHKHVPLMEDHPGAAISNNLFGTKSVAEAAMACGCERFVLISSDKAVGPTSVMGATKRMAELCIRALNGRGPTRFSLVRFGNVLGSACSVLPIWRTQLADTGAVGVTDERMTRYFMTIPEAAALVIQSAALPTGEVFVLDMGEPVRIMDLATRFLAQHGLDGVRADSPPEGIAHRPRARIEIIGIRPGEKLYEELAYAAEDLDHTSLPGVLAWPGDAVDPAWVQRLVTTMEGMRSVHEPARVIDEIARWIPMQGPPQPVGTPQTGRIRVSAPISPQPMVGSDAA
ncbi:MAG: polysaccharide biosynthesis protein [Planctomycetota bacterium]